MTKRRTNYDLPAHETGAVRGGLAASKSIRDAKLNELRARVASAQRLVEEAEAREAGFLRRIAQLEQTIADRDEALIDALRRMHEAMSNG